MTGIWKKYPFALVSHLLLNIDVEPFFNWKRKGFLSNSLCVDVYVEEKEEKKKKISSSVLLYEVVLLVHVCAVELLIKKKKKDLSAMIWGSCVVHTG